MALFIAILVVTVVTILADLVAVALLLRRRQFAVAAGIIIGPMLGVLTCGGPVVMAQLQYLMSGAGK